MALFGNAKRTSPRGQVGNGRCGCGRTMPKGRVLCPRCSHTVAADVQRGAKASTPAAPYTCAVQVGGRACGRTVRGGTRPSPDHS